VRKGDSADEITVDTYLHVREDRDASSMASPTARSASSSFSC
jgi:hypothetical protein